MEYLLETYFGAPTGKDCGLHDKITRARTTQARTSSATHPLPHAPLCHSASTSRCRLRQGAPLPDGAPRTKMGYTGHLPGRHYSTNYGASFNATAGKLLVNPDVAVPLTIGEFRDERPPRLQAAVAGYKGFRPRATPL